MRNLLQNHECINFVIPVVVVFDDGLLEHEPLLNLRGIESWPKTKTREPFAQLQEVEKRKVKDETA